MVSFDWLDDPDGMPDHVSETFQTHYDIELEPSGRIEQAITDIETVYDRDPEAVVACSGGKDSMATLALAASSDADHRALHYDWGTQFVPRDLERELVDNIRQFVPDDRLFAATVVRPVFELYVDNDHFQRYLTADPGGEQYEGVSRLAGALRHADEIGIQFVSLRREESGKRARKLDGLWGGSLGQPAAFPLRGWSARDVWAYLVGEGVPHPSYYDRVASATGGGHRAYEQARFTTLHDQEFELLSVDGVAAWNDRQITD